MLKLLEATLYALTSPLANDNPAMYQRKFPRALHTIRT
jgi:hypothetical protein